MSPSDFIYLFIYLFIYFIWFYLLMDQILFVSSGLRTSDTESRKHRRKYNSRARRNRPSRTPGFRCPFITWFQTLVIAMLVLHGRTVKGRGSVLKRKLSWGFCCFSVTTVQKSLKGQCHGVFAQNFYKCRKCSLNLWNKALVSTCTCSNVTINK